MIYLTLLNGTGYIFSVDDYMTLRQQHRIVGAIVGTSSSKGWSLNESTMPVALTLWETQLLVEQGIATLLSKQQVLERVATPAELEIYQSNFEARLEQQQDTFKAEKLREAERNMSKILAGKRKKLLKEGVADSDIQLEPADILAEIASDFVFDRKNALVEIPCTHPGPHVGESMRLPVNKSLKYRVFRDLWQRGKYYITGGDSFGADFLIYPGDPLLYHASHILILLPEGKLPCLELITKVRLSVIVNKLCVFAYLRETDAGAEPVIHYHTIEWGKS